jgi:hypothetical protein
MGISIAGGAEEGEFLQIGMVDECRVNYELKELGLIQDFLNCIKGIRRDGELKKGDIILEMQGRSVVGLRRREFHGLLHDIDETAIIVLKCVPANCLSHSLVDFLSGHHPAGSPDHQLQSAVLDNIQKIVPPLTTRAPRRGEVDGKDYCFVTDENLFKMERAGRILQYRRYDGKKLFLRQDDYSSSIVFNC